MPSHKSISDSSYRHTRGMLVTQEPCSVYPCSRRPRARGLCAKHYREARNRGDFPDLPKCSQGGCTKTLYAKKLCEEHYQSLQYHRDPQKRVRVKRGQGSINKITGHHMIYVNGRPRPEHRVVMEAALGRKLRRAEVVRHINGDLLDNRIENLRVEVLGKGTVNVQGYRCVYVKGERVLEHRIIMEKHIGRPLRGDENVHHKNGDRLDNRLDNLEIWSSFQPSGQRIKDKVAWAREIISLYAHLVDE